MKCNRKACQAELVEGETYFNQSTRAYYCQRCAIWLNRDPFNEADAKRLYNGPLCIKQEPPAMEDHHEETNPSG